MNKDADGRVIRSGDVYMHRDKDGISQYPIVLMCNMNHDKWVYALFTYGTDGIVISTGMGTKSNPRELLHKQDTFIFSLSPALLEIEAHIRSEYST